MVLSVNCQSKHSSILHLGCLQANEKESHTKPQVTLCSRGCQTFRGQTVYPEARSQKGQGSNYKTTTPTAPHSKYIPKSVCSYKYLWCYTLWCKNFFKTAKMIKIRMHFIEIPIFSYKIRSPLKRASKIAMFTNAS